MKPFFSIIFLIISIVTSNAQDSTKTTLPKEIKLVRDPSDGYNKIVMFENQYNCIEDIEPYINLSKNEKAINEFKLYKKKTDKSFGFALFGMMSSSAALGQLGQGYKRLTIYAGVSALSFITFSILKNNKRHLKKAIKHYNNDNLIIQK
jgi:hypothetical protein